MDAEISEGSPVIPGRGRVIILGVLIGLAADRWIQDLGEDTQAQFYLQQLILDLQAD